MGEGCRVAMLTRHQAQTSSGDGQTRVLLIFQFPV